MFVSGFNINLQVAVSIQLYKELCNNNNNNNNNNKVFWAHLKHSIELPTTHMKSIQYRFISWNLIKSHCYMTSIKIMSKGVFHIAQCASLWFTRFLCSHDLLQMSLIVGVVIVLSNPILL